MPLSRTHRTTHKPATVTAFISAPRRGTKSIHILPKASHLAGQFQGPPPSLLGRARDYTANPGLRPKSVDHLGAEGGGTGYSQGIPDPHPHPIISTQTTGRSARDKMQVMEVTEMENGRQDPHSSSGRLSTKCLPCVIPLSLPHTSVGIMNPICRSKQLDMLSRHAKWVYPAWYSCQCSSNKEWSLRWRQEDCYNFKTILAYVVIHREALSQQRKNIFLKEAAGDILSLPITLKALPLTSVKRCVSHREAERDHRGDTEAYQQDVQAHTCNCNTRQTKAGG